MVDLDAFLYAEALAEKRLDTDHVKRWLDRFNDIKPSTKRSKLCHVRKFAAYLKTLGIETTLPQLPRVSTDFTPYVFSQEEMTRIFDEADDLVFTSSGSRVAAEFPVLLRILYGCGLRLGEATSLTWDDIDLDDGVIKVKNAKNNKQRSVPMAQELTRILKLYRNSPHFDMQEHGLLFKKGDGEARTNGAYWSVFDRILCGVGIKNTQTVMSASRGPCLHSLRHTFTLNSLLKAELEGKTFIETVPFLSTYLGHDGLMETDKYLKARHELYATSHGMIEDYTRDVFPEEVESES